MAAYHIVIDGPPGETAGRFVEVEDGEGKSINAGEWHERPDGYWELRIEAVPRNVAEPSMRLVGNLIDHQAEHDWMDIDGGDFQDLAIKAGIYRPVPYDPEKHGTQYGEDWDAEPGDEYTALTEAGDAAFKLAKEKSDGT